MYGDAHLPHRPLRRRVARGAAPAAPGGENWSVPPTSPRHHWKRHRVDPALRLRVALAAARGVLFASPEGRSRTWGAPTHRTRDAIRLYCSTPRRAASLPSSPSAARSSAGQRSSAAPDSSACSTTVAACATSNGLVHHFDIELVVLKEDRDDVQRRSRLPHRARLRIAPTMETVFQLTSSLAASCMALGARSWSRETMPMMGFCNC